MIYSLFATLPDWYVVERIVLCVASVCYKLILSVTYDINIHRVEKAVIFLSR